MQQPQQVRAVLFRELFGPERGEAHCSSRKQSFGVSARLCAKLDKLCLRVAEAKQCIGAMEDTMDEERDAEIRAGREAKRQAPAVVSVAYLVNMFS